MISQSQPNTSPRPDTPPAVDPKKILRDKIKLRINSHVRVSNADNR